MRRETITVHISNLLKDILQEEQELEKSMISSLQDNEVELAALCESLGLPIEKVRYHWVWHVAFKLPHINFVVQPSTDQSLYEREKITRTRVDALNKV